MSLYQDCNFSNDLNNTLNAYDNPDSYGMILNKFLNDLTEVSTTFFLSKSNEIASIYNAIREDKYPYNKVMIVDVERSMLLFGDYFPGLQEYAEHLVRLDNSVNISKESVKKTVEGVCDKSGAFIESIIRGNRNPEKSVTINDAMLNVEKLSLIISSYNVYNEKTKAIFESLKGKDNSKFIEEITLGMRTYVTAIGDFAYCCMGEIINSYNNIINSMKLRIPAGGIKEEPKYRIF